MKTQEAHFDEVAGNYDVTIPEHVMAYLTDRRVQFARSLCPTGRVLDVGCGTGRFISSLPEAYDPTGVDISAGMLHFAKEKGLDVMHASAGSLPFDDDSFDLVTSIAVLHHLVDRDLVRDALHEMVRVTRPGGAVFVCDLNWLNPYWKVLMARLPQDQGDERLVPARLILKGLSEAGVQDLKLRRITFTPDFTPKILLPSVIRLERILERIPILNLVAAHNIVTARI